MAWAYWHNSVLFSCGLATTKPNAFLGDAAYDIVHQIPVYRGDTVVVEQMVHYPGQRGAKADATANDLLDLQAIGGYVAGYFKCPVKWIPAREWKGQVPKTVTRSRVIKTLSDGENYRLAGTTAKYPKSLHHNLYDAVGLGLYALGRKYNG